MNLGKIIKEYRERHLMSQREFAILCDVSNGYISMLEEGINPKTNEPIVPSLSTLQKLASAMDMTVNELISEAYGNQIPISNCEGDCPQNSELGQRIKVQRIKLGMTQEELAKRAGYTSRSSINKIELGLIDLPLSKIHAIAKALDVTFPYILGLETKDTEEIEKNYYERIASCGERIKIGLKKRGMKQTDLCELTKIPKSAMSQYVSGSFEPKQDRIYLIAQALNVNEAWLRGYNVPMSKISTCSERIRNLIEQSGLSYHVLEKYTGIKKSSLQRYASGSTTKIPLDAIVKLSKVFNVSKEYLMGGSEEQKTTLSEEKLTEGEKTILELFRQVPEDKQDTVIQMFQVALGHK